MKLVSVFTEATSYNWWPHRWSDGGAVVVMPDNLDSDLYRQVAPDLIYSFYDHVDPVVFTLEGGFLRCVS